MVGVNVYGDGDDDGGDSGNGGGGKGGLGYGDVEGMRGGVG